VVPRPLALALAALVALAVAGAPRPAAAYCRSSVCQVPGGSDQGKRCAPPEPDDCGVVLQWRQPCVGFTVQKDASSQVDLATSVELMRHSFETWMLADCGGSLPSILVEDLGLVECSDIEYNQHAGNANVLIFRDLEWPHLSESVSGTTDTIALTTVTYDVEDGSIFDADIEVNTATFLFTTADVTLDTDLLSVLTHEAGHFLGMSHSSIPDATMQPDYTPGSIDLRTLTTDDVLGICDIYPPGREALGECTSLPRHGFSPSCRADQTEGKCSISQGFSPIKPIAIAAPLTLAALALARRRRHSRRPRNTSFCASCAMDPPTE
jgi:hypothetical protein